MLAEVMREPTYGVYRSRLEYLLQIPTDASDLEIHEMIQFGFDAERLMKLCDQGDVTPLERDRIIPLKTLKTRIAKEQKLTVDESDRLFRAAHITAMASAIFGDDQKARRWLSKPKERFSGSSPMAMFTTIQGTRQVEEMLIQLAEGFSF
ncbi:antitoxin Xre/MbcA/ParS toxin-binding domain-containing protein [Pseudomonas asplenii]|uniref:antitoxin Xre/MbcA/ParS toxin-binding domain-containing protein n=1 Tax=Pseudomonas asplenii TaxID=53407 RepID=UPI00236049AC|nr:antitoxin Xre/MbcA/ParS toxin-binding domain-containing protein [Pseudomonas asplenii]